jgi:hypothetical protein
VAPAGVADIVPQQKRVETDFGGLEILDGIVAGPAQIADGLVFDLGHIDGRQVPRAQQAGQLDGVTAIGVDPVASLCGNQRGGHDPAHVALLRQIAIEPRAARTGLVHTDQVLAFRRQLTDALIDVAWSSTNGTQANDSGRMVFGTIGHRDRVLMDIHADVKSARLVHG